MGVQRAAWRPLQEVELAADIQVGGLLHELHDFGPTSRDSDVFFPDGTSVPPDGIATGQIASTADGVTYWVGAEAPRGIASLPEDPIGGRAQLRQTQSFIKRDFGASLSFTVTRGVHRDDRPERCPRPQPARPSTRTGCSATWSRVSCSSTCTAFTVPAAPDIIPFDTFFHVAGGATVSGYAENW